MTAGMVPCPICQVPQLVLKGLRNHIRNAHHRDPDEMLGVPTYRQIKPIGDPVPAVVPPSDPSDVLSIGEWCEAHPRPKAPDADVDMRSPERRYLDLLLSWAERDGPNTDLLDRIEPALSRWPVEQPARHPRGRRRVTSTYPRSSLSLVPSAPSSNGSPITAVTTPTSSWVSASSAASHSSAPSEGVGPSYSPTAASASGSSCSPSSPPSTRRQSIPRKRPSAKDADRMVADLLDTLEALAKPGPSHTGATVMGDLLARAAFSARPDGYGSGSSVTGALLNQPTSNGALRTHLYDPMPSHHEHGFVDDTSVEQAALDRMHDVCDDCNGAGTVIAHTGEVPRALSALQRHGPTLGRPHRRGSARHRGRPDRHAPASRHRRPQAPDGDARQGRRQGPGVRLGW